MAYQARIKPSAEKELERIPEQYHLRILTTISEIAADPHIGKKLKGKRKGEWSYRVWPYRIIYQIRKRELVILIIHIGHRQGSYKK